MGKKMKLGNSESNRDTQDGQVISDEFPTSDGTGIVARVGPFQVRKGQM